MRGEISVIDLYAWLSDPSITQPVLLDVRKQWEWDLVHIEGAIHMPMNEISIRLDEIPFDRTIVTLCHHGVRSFQAALYLKNAGLASVLSVSGGIEAWATQIDTRLGHY